MNRKLESGQGIVEYAFILVLLLIVVIIIGSIFAPETFEQLIGKPTDDTLEYSVQQTLDAYERWVDVCVADERYDRATCEQLGLGVEP